MQKTESQRTGDQLDQSNDEFNSKLLVNAEEKDGSSDLERSRSRPKFSLSYKVTRICAMYANLLTCGIAQSLLGTTLLELQIQTSAEFDRLTMLVTWGFLGRVLSAIMASAVFDRLHPEMQVGAVSAVFAAVSVCIPLTSEYLVLAVLVMVQGFCMGYISTGSGARCFELLGEKVGPFLQALYFSYSVGGAIAPPIVKPFLTPMQESNSTNYTEVQEPYINSTGNITTEESRIHPGTFYPYLILAVAELVVFVYHVVLFSMDKCKPLRQKSKSEETIAAEKVDIRMLALFGSLLFCSVGMEISFGTFLYSYTVKHLGWPVGTANTLLFVFWATFALSRAFGMLHARFVHPKTILTIFLALQTVSFILIAFLSHVSAYVMWASVASLGVAMSTQVASIYLYAGKHVRINGRTSGVLMVSCYVSGMANPALTGLLFHAVSMQWFLYLQLIFMALMLGFFVTIRVLSAKNERALVIDIDSQEIDSKAADYQEKVPLDSKVT